MQDRFNWFISLFWLGQTFVQLWDIVCPMIMTYVAFIDVNLTLTSILPVNLTLGERERERERENKESFARKVRQSSEADKLSSSHGRFTWLDMWGIWTMFRTRPGEGSWPLKIQKIKCPGVWPGGDVDRCIIWWGTPWVLIISGYSLSTFTPHSSEKPLADPLSELCFTVVWKELQPSFLPAISFNFPFSFCDFYFLSSRALLIFFTENNHCVFKILGTQRLRKTNFVCLSV